MKVMLRKAAIGTSLAVLLALPGCASSDRPRTSQESELKTATGRVESGAKTTGEGIKETAKGVGNTVEEGAKTTGERFKDAGQQAKPEMKSAWDDFKDSASSFGHGVKDFFKGLAGKSD